MEADLDPQKQRIGRKRTGEAGGAYAVGQLAAKLRQSAN